MPGMISDGLLSSATPTGLTPTWTRSSTNENSSATTRVGVPWIVSEPSVPFTVREAARAVPQVGSNPAFCAATAPADAAAARAASRAGATSHFFTTPSSLSSCGLLLCRSGARKRVELRAFRRHFGVLVSAVKLEDLRLELLEERLAAPEPVAGFPSVGGSEPVPFLHPVEPVADLLELHPDLFRLLVAVVLAEVLELDLLDEVDLAVLDDLGVVLCCVVDEQLDDLLLLFGRELGEREQVIRAVALVDAREHPVELCAQIVRVGQHADGVLQVHGAGLLQAPPYGDASGGRLRRHPVDELDEALWSHRAVTSLAPTRRRRGR